MIGFGASAMEVVYCALPSPVSPRFSLASSSRRRWSWSVLFLCLPWHPLSHHAHHPDDCAGGGENQSPATSTLSLLRRPCARHGQPWGVLVLDCPGGPLPVARLGRNFLGRRVLVRGWCGAGTSVWFSGLSYAVSRGHGRFTEKTLLRWNTAPALLCCCWLWLRACISFYRWCGIRCSSVPSVMTLMLLLCKQT